MRHLRTRTMRCTCLLLCFMAGCTTDRGAKPPLTPTKIDEQTESKTATAQDIQSDFEAEKRERDRQLKLVWGRVREISAELKELPSHPWAGAYYQGDGLGVNLDLDLAPKAGAAFLWRGCLGMYGQNLGPITA